MAAAQVNDESNDEGESDNESGPLLRVVASFVLPDYKEDIKLLKLAQRLRKAGGSWELQMTLEDQPIMKLRRSQSAKRALGGIFETRLNANVLAYMDLQHKIHHPDNFYKVSGRWCSGNPVMNLDGTVWFTVVNSWSRLGILPSALAQGLAISPARIQISYCGFNLLRSGHNLSSHAAILVFGANAQPQISITILTPDPTFPENGWAAISPSIDWHGRSRHSFVPS